MICAPEASWACFMTSIDEYLPVPTMRRDENSLPPMTRFVSFMALASVPYPPPIGLTISTRSPSRSTVASYALFGVTSRFTATAVYWRLTPSCVRRPSTLSPSVTSRSLPLTTIFISKTAAPLHGCGRWFSVRRVPFAGITQGRFEGSRAAPGSQDSSPHDVWPKYTSDPGELSAGRGHQPRQRSVDPALARRQHHRRRAHVERPWIASGRGRPVVTERSRRAHQAPAHLDDGAIAGAQVLERPIDDVPLALLDRLVLHAEAGDAAEHAGAVRLPVHLVVVAAVGRRADIAVGLRRRRQIVADVSALAGDVQVDLLARERAVGMPGDHPVDDVGIVHRDPDVRLRDLLVEVGRRHRVEG